MWNKKRRFAKGFQSYVKFDIENESDKHLRG